MNPQYIKLTAVKITVPPQHRGQPAQMTMLQPPVVELIPLPCLFQKSQVDGRTERNNGGLAVTYRESFDDVLQAINDAATFSGAIAVPIDRESIAQAAESVRPLPAPILPPTVQEAVEVAVNGVKAAIEGEEACRGHGDPDLVVVDDKGPQWNDFAQTDGENVGAPKYKRQPRVGDLRIHSCEQGRYFLEQAHQGDRDAEDIIWAAPNLPFPLLRTFDSRDQLIEEVAKAGRESLLVNA